MRKTLPLRLTAALWLAATIVLASCGGAGSSEVVTEPTPTPEETMATGKVVAEARIEPSRWSELRFQTGGILTQVLVEPGDNVEAGDVLMRLDRTAAQWAVREAELALVEAQAELAVLHAGPRAEEIEAAEASLQDAEAALERAMAQRDEVIGGATAAQIASAHAELTAAEAEWLMSREERDELYRRTNEGDEDDGEQRDQANYRFHAAAEALVAAQAAFDARRNTADERVREAEARVASASAQRDVASAELALLSVGSSPWEVMSAQAKVEQARAALKRAEADLDREVLYAPFDGTVTRVNAEVGERVDTNSVVAVLGTIDRLEAHTVDLTELDVARLREGQAALVTTDALPEARVRGHVVRVGLRSVEYRGDETYPVVVELEETAPEFRWGLTAVVEIELD